MHPGTRAQQLSPRWSLCRQAAPRCFLLAVLAVSMAAVGRATRPLCAAFAIPGHHRLAPGKALRADRLSLSGAHGPRHVASPPGRQRARGLRMEREMPPRYNLGTPEREVVDKLFADLESGLQESSAISGLQQGSQEWLNARKNRLTASNFGAAAGRNRFMSPTELAREMLYSTFKGNDATRWGNEKEPLAMDAYISQMRQKLPPEDAQSFSVTTSGLHLCQTHPWLAASPDGHAHVRGTTGLIEIKCPFSQRIYPKIPEYYYDQLQVPAQHCLPALVMLGVAFHFALL